MLWLRRFTFLILVAAGLTVIYVAIHVFWNVRPYDYIPAASETQAQIVSDRLMVYSRQAEDVARLVAILLIVSGLYTIAQAILAQLAAERVLHRLDDAIDTTRHEFALAAGDLRELKEDVNRAVERSTAQAAAIEEIRAEVRQRLGMGPWSPATPAPPKAPEPVIEDKTAPIAEVPQPEPEAVPEEPAPLESALGQEQSVALEEPAPVEEPVAAEEPPAVEEPVAVEAPPAVAVEEAPAIEEPVFVE